MADISNPASEPLGDASALDAAALWAEFGPALRAFLARRVPPGVEPDDLLQDLFLRVVRNLGSLRSTERPEAWLFQIARNALRDSLRARLRRDGRTDVLDADLPDDDAVDDRLARAELAPCLTGMVQRLAEPYRTAIRLTSLEGLSQADAARQVGISISGMKSRVQRGRVQLRQMLVRCCVIAVDVRGGVADFHLRESGACGGPPSQAAEMSCGCGAAQPCGSDRDSSDASNMKARRLQQRGRMNGAPEEDIMSKVESTVSSKADVGSTASTNVKGCCGGPSPAGMAGCCAQDAAIKADGGEGCGCGPTVAPTTASTPVPPRAKCC